MDLLGYISATTDPPGINLERWVHLIAAHPNLEAFAPREGINPFTKGPYTYRPHPGSAWVVITGRRAGSMHWALDGSNQIVVWADPATVYETAVNEIATDVAMQVGGSYRREEE